MRPSLLAHVLHGITAGVSTCMGIYWLSTNPMQLSPDVIFAILIVFLLIISIIWGLHAVSHAQQEYYFNWNPLNFSK